MPDTAVLDALHVRAAEAVVRYLDSFDRGGPGGRTHAVERVADAVAEAGLRPGSLGPAWALVDAWQTAHRVLDGPYEGAWCPCAKHTSGSRVTVGNLAVLVGRARPDLTGDLATLTRPTTS